MGSSPGPCSSGEPGGPAPRSRGELYAALQDRGRRMTVGLLRLLHAMSVRADLNPTEFQCLVLLAAEGPLTPGEVARGLRLSSGSVTGVIDRLERRGLLLREPHLRDRRKTVLRCAAPESAEWRGAAVGLPEVLTAPHRDYSEEELALIADWLHRLNGLLYALSSDGARPVP